MSGRLFLVAVIAAALSASAQQGSGGNSGTATPPQASSPQPSSPAQDGAAKSGASNSAQQGDSSQSNPSSPSKTAPNSAQPPASDLSRDLTFPGDKPENTSTSSAGSPKAPNLTPPRSDRVQADALGTGLGQSSSKDTQTDLSAPSDDLKAHPQSSAAVAEADAGGGGVTEFHTWDPHKAAKSVEVGDFYFKRKNYRAAEDRYREALRYKDNDAVATIRLAVSLEKLGELDDARAEYESYLRILPHGPQANEAQQAIDRLKGQKASTGETK